MKADARRIRAALAAPGDLRLFLLHGPDMAGAAELVSLLVNAVGEGAERIDLDGATLAKDPARLAVEAASLSLFGGARLIRVTAVGDESVPAIEALMTAGRAGNPVIAIAPAARTTSRLVKLVQAAPLALAYGCYEPSEHEAERIAATMTREAGLIAEPGVARRLVIATGSDRAVMAREIAKFALYLDADPARPLPLGHDTIDAVGADLGEGEATKLVAAVVEGRAADLGRELGLIDPGGSPVSWLRAIVRRLIALAEIRAEIDAGRSPGAVMKRHRIFRDEAAVERLARHWSPAHLAEAVARMQAAERQATASGTAGAVMADQAAIALTRAAARH